MRKTMTGLAAAVAVMTVTAVPAMACGYSACASSCGGGLFQAFANPCGGYAYGGYGYGSYGGGYSYSNYDRLPSPQYYYVNQGPTYTGPGAFAPIPTYQERAVSGSSAYSQPYYHGYTGGPYANPSHHYYDGARVSGPVVYRFKPRRHYHGLYRPAYRYGYRPVVRYAQPRVVYARPAYHAPRYHVAPRVHHHRHHAPVLRRYN
ncbi:MAG: hypothetical protein A4S14_08385 [Proteobacteria bacterium SG_bin9]|nr:MAG: hypothetical protein A4S14_08385 [Proteobacteria bacterium SG_bin9]